MKQGDMVLTDEEIRQELAKLPDADLFLPSAYKETSIKWNEFVAKTQLKKVGGQLQSKEGGNE